MAGSPAGGIEENEATDHVWIVLCALIVALSNSVGFGSDRTLHAELAGNVTEMNQEIENYNNGQIKRCDQRTQATELLDSHLWCTSMKMKWKRRKRKCAENCLEWRRWSNMWKNERRRERKEMNPVECLQRRRGRFAGLKRRCSACADTSVGRWFVLTAGAHIGRTQNA